jgi:pilus assembly protein CpaF
MSRLPSRPFGNNPKETPAAAVETPHLSSGEEYISVDDAAPQFAAETTPVAPRTLPGASVLPPRVTAPVSPPTAPTASEPVFADDVPPAPEVTSEPVNSADAAPSIETLSFDGENATNAELEAQKRREYAINNLPKELQRSIHRLFELITDDTSSEVTINGPQSVGFKRSGQRFLDNTIDFIDTNTYHAIINSFLLPLTNTRDRIGETPHLIEGQLVVPDSVNPTRPPLIARVHIVAPPAVDNAKITIAKKARTQYTVDAMIASGALTRDMGDFLKSVARGRATIVFSGLSGSGKTTLLEAMSREFDVSDRIVLVEDTEELSLPVSDLVALRSHQARPGEDLHNSISLEWLVRQANRMRPDRIIVGEVRGAEMAEFLTAANSGADGSMTTVHASSPQKSINKMLSLSLKSDSVKSETSILRDIASTVQIIVQMSLIDGRHVISQIEEVSDTVNQNGLGIQTSTIFRFDRNTGRFSFENRPSDEFQMFLKQRGVSIAIPTNFIRQGY